MSISLSIPRNLLLAACAALVTAGCGGGGATPASSAAAGTTGTSPHRRGRRRHGGRHPRRAPTAPSAPHAQHKRCGWIGADTFAAGKASFLANPDYYDAIHPKWGTLNPDGSVRVLSMADDADIMSTAKSHSIKVIPLIDADDVSYIRNVMSSPAAIAQHAQMMTDLVVQHGCDGVELDYEHLWTAADRAPYVALVKAVAASLHAQHKLLTLALPAMDVDHPDSAYDYAQIQNDVDVLHLMGYDFHYFGGDHLGPLAPKGWINDVVTRVQSLGHPEKYTLGLANYGISTSWYTSGQGRGRTLRRLVLVADRSHDGLPARTPGGGPGAALHDRAGRRLVRGRGVDDGEGAARQGARPRRRRLLDDGRRARRLLRRDAGAVPQLTHSRAHARAPSAAQPIGSSSCPPPPPAVGGGSSDGGAPRSAATSVCSFVNASSSS